VALYVAIVYLYLDVCCGGFGDTTLQSGKPVSIRRSLGFLNQGNQVSIWAFKSLRKMSYTSGDDFFALFGGVRPS